MTDSTDASRTVAPGTLLISFADGSERWRRAGRRFEREAQSTGWFSEVRVYDAQRLRDEFPEFFARRAQLYEHTTPGYGFWSWKPFLLRKHLESTGPSARIMYLDAGSHFNVTPRSERRFREYERATERDGALLMRMPHLPERDWTKPAVLEHFRISSEDSTSGQLVGGVIMLARSGPSFELCREWESAMALDNYRLVRDPETPQERGPYLREHRHDQSVFSCLAKARGLASIPDETFFAPKWHERGSDFPIWTVRNRSGVRFSTKRPWFKAKKIAERISLLAGGDSG